VQPNGVTPDREPGVQMGELPVITSAGVERMHRYPTGVQMIETSVGGTVSTIYRSRSRRKF
jgi:hypothetical protein